MSEIFKTVLILSALGSILIIPLLIIKPITSKKFPAVWQYIIWIAVMLSMLLPIYKIIPVSEQKAQDIPPVTQTVSVIPSIPYESNQPRSEQSAPPSQTQQASGHTEEATASSNNPTTPEASAKQPEHAQDFRLNIPKYVAYIWFLGVCIFLSVIIISYMIYLAKKRRNSTELSHNPILEDAKKELNIKRSIRLRRMTSDACSPMLVGIFLPTIYLPDREISDENLRMVFLHELMHHKRKDLVFKWLSALVNAIHWFNPFVYLLSSNLNEACEISCDMAVTKTMNDAEQKAYMKTILDLVE